MVPRKTPNVFSSKAWLGQNGRVVRGCIDDFVIDDKMFLTKWYHTRHQWLRMLARPYGARVQKRYLSV
jgi:hypothetical protein